MLARADVSRALQTIDDVLYELSFSPCHAVYAFLINQILLPACTEKRVMKGNER